MTDEQQRVRRALRFLYEKMGDWTLVAKALRFKRGTVLDAAIGNSAVSVNLAFRTARLMKVPVDDMLDGKFALPPARCPHCGQITP